MCGIAGAFCPTGVRLQRLPLMSALLRHRGPDDEGFTLVGSDATISHRSGEDSVDEIRLRYPHITNDRDFESKHTAGFVHRRLSILDLTVAGHQPMVSRSSRYILTYSGEVYNYLELRSLLETDGVTFLTRTDTEVVLAAWERWGTECLHKFVGMWAFCLYDVQEQKAYLVRDRFGIKPLYYAVEGDTFVFSSELKAIVQTAGSSPQICSESVAEFLFYGSTSNPSGNLLEVVEEVPEGSYLLYDTVKASFTVVQYYRFGATGSSEALDGDSQSAYKRFSEMLNESIELHLRADVPVGVCLSGGVDSSYIVSYLASHHPSVSLKTFTAGYKDQKIDESYLALRVRDRYSLIEASVVYPEIETTWSSLGRQIYHHDIPFHSSSMFAQWSVMESVQAGGIKVVMNGQGSDELIGGYYTFAGQHLLDLLFRFRFLHFLGERKALKSGFSKHVEKDMLRALYNYLPVPLQKIARQQNRVGAKLLRPEYISLLSEGGRESKRRRGYRGMTIESVRFGLQQLLRYEDRISMAFSIESRVPFLDHRFAEFVLAMKPEWKLREGWTKYPLRKAGEGLVPEEIRLRRDKMGFLTPAEVWLKRKQSEILDYIADSPVQNIIDPSILRSMSKGPHYDPTHVSETWKIFVLAKWLEIFNVRV